MVKVPTEIPRLKAWPITGGPTGRHGEAYRDGSSEKSSGSARVPWRGY